MFGVVCLMLMDNGFLLRVLSAVFFFVCVCFLNKSVALAVDTDDGDNV